MAKIQIKSEKLTPFGGIFSIMEKFDSMLSPVIDSTLGQRCSSIFGYQFSEIVRSLMSVYFCGGSCVEDVTSQLMRHLSYHPTLRTCSSDTILRAIKELTQENISYTSDQGKTYDFNTADKLNTLLINALVSTGELKEIEEYDVDFDHHTPDGDKLKLDKKSYSIKTIKFKCNCDEGEVKGIVSDQGKFIFKEIYEQGDTFEWILDLKDLHSQRIVTNYVSSLSRIGLDESEWLRIAGN